MARKTLHPKIKVQAVYTGNRDMREVFISLLVDTVRRENHSVRTFENVKDTQYNENRKQEKEVI